MDNSYTDPNNQTNLNDSVQPENNIPSKIPTGSSLSYIIKSMGGTKAVSALFGMLLLAGGVGAGIVLVTQPQLLEQRAATTGYILCDPNSGRNTCPAGYTCDADFGRCVNGDEMIDCGGLQCKYKNCHCLNGDLCDLGYECVSDDWIKNVCTDQGREWCTNVQDGIGMTCCQPGYICNPAGEGCVPGAGGPTSGPGTGTSAPVPTKSPSPIPTRSPSPTPSATPSATPTATPTRSPSPTPSATPIVAQCVSTNIYTPAWSPVTIADFYNLPAGAQVYFCTQGTTNGLTFDKARFTINGVLRPEVTLQRPNGTDFCDLYTIPANTYSFTVQGEIHHTTLGWL